MKILLVITKSELGGAQNFVLSLARGLKALGYEAVIAGGAGDYLPAAAQTDGIRFIRLDSLKRSRNPLAAQRFSKEIQELLAKEAFDIVHLNSSNALSCTKALQRLKNGPRTVFTVHGLSVLDPGYRAPLALKLAYRLWFLLNLKTVDSVVFVSRGNLDFALENFLVNTGHLIYNGTELNGQQLLSREAARHELSDWTGVNLEHVELFGSIGRLAYPKNYEFLIKTWPALLKNKPLARLIIIGEGPERKKYEKLISELGLQRFVWLPGGRSQASRYLPAFDRFVLPSIYEGLPLTVVEAGAAGVPILTSAVGGLPEILSYDELYKPGDQADFLEKANKKPVISRTPEEWQEKFGAKVMVEKYLNLYKKLLNN